MAEHANEYLTLNTRASQGRIVNKLWPVLHRRRECSTALRGMPRTALAPIGISARFGLTASACQLVSQGLESGNAGKRPTGRVLTSRPAEPGGGLTSVELK